jgi:gliding motility-associated-like protein
MDLTINNSVSTTDSLVACDSAEWNGNVYTLTGIYIDTLGTVEGCDSIITMDLTINNSVATTDSLVACDSAEWNGNVYVTTGIYVDTLSTISGCDSIVTMDLTINYANTGTDSLVACDSAEWNGNVYTTTGIYIDTIPNMFGCDSIITMDLTINNSIATTDSLVACDSAEWNGNVYTLTGIYIDTLGTVEGCDSIITMDLTINNSVATTDSLVACDSAEWNGIIYTSTGIYSQNFSTSQGCDSIVEMNITIHNTLTTFDVQSACNEYIWNGNIYNSTGTYIDTLQTIHGCDSIMYLNLTINYSTPFSAGSDTALCSGEIISLNASGTGTITWDNGVVNGQPFVVDSTRIYTAQMTNLSGCLSYNTLQVTVYNLPLINAGTSQTICLGDSNQLIADGTGSLSWYHPSILITDSIFVSPLQTTTYYLNAIDTNGCTNNDSITVSVNDLPNITIDSIPPLCYGDSVTLNANGGVLSIWSGGISNNSNFVPDSSTIYYVNVTDASGCQNTDSVLVQVNQIPNLFAGLDTSICLFDTITLTATGTVQSFNWTNNINNGIAFSPNASNQYIVSGIDSNSCYNADTINVNVITIPVDAGLDTELCLGESITLSGVGPNPTWDLGVIDGIEFNPDSSNNYILSVSDINGCVRYDSVLVTVHDLPNVIAPNDTLACRGDEIQLFGLGANTYQWDNGYFNGELFIPETPGFHIVTGIDSNRCENTDTMYIEIKENPEINYTINPVVYGNDASIMVTVSGGNPWQDCGIAEFEQAGPCQEPYLYDWDSDGLGDMDDDLHLFYLNPGNYFITVYDSLTCRDTATITINDDYQIFIPTAITPNADGYNDTWLIRGINNFPSASILVFDIQGQVIFQHNNNNGDYQPWNGTYQSGQLLLSADYYYQIILDTDNPTQNNTLTGSIMITF